MITPTGLCSGRKGQEEAAGCPSQFIIMEVPFNQAFPGGSVLKDLPANARDVGSISGSGRSSGEGSGNLLQYSCLENPTDRGTWRATVHEVKKS